MCGARYLSLKGRLAMGTATTSGWYTGSSLVISSPEPLGSQGELIGWP